MNPKKILRRSYGWWKSQCIKKNDNDYRHTILLAGSARSGTTWLAEIINYDARYRYIFEPFNTTEVSLCKDFEERQYLSPEKKSIKFHQPIEEILNGKIRNHWADFYNVNTANAQRLVKCIRANFLLEYIHKYFPALPIVFLIRHPFAVAYSRMKLGWRAPLASLFQQNELLTKQLLPYQHLQKTIKTDFEKQVLFWCLENKIPLQILANQLKFKLVFYEDLVSQPEESIKDIFQFLKLDFNADILTKLDIPSSSATLHSPKKAIGSWKENLSSTDLKQGLVILEKLGMDCFYGDQVFPVK